MSQTVTQTLNHASNCAVSTLLASAQHHRTKKRMRNNTDDNLRYESPLKKRKIETAKPLQIEMNHKEDNNDLQKEAFGFSSSDDDDDDDDNDSDPFNEDAKKQQPSDNEQEPLMDIHLFDMDENTNTDLNQSTNSLNNDPYWNMMQTMNQSRDNLIDLDDSDTEQNSNNNNKSNLNNSCVSIQIDIEESSMFNVKDSCDTKKTKSAKKKDVMRYQKWQRDQGIECTQAHLALLVYRARFRTLLCSDCELQARAMSIVPLKLHPTNDPSNGIYTELTLLQLRRVLQWFLNAFRFDADTKQFELKCPTAKDRIPCALFQIMEYIIDVGENKTPKKKCSISHLNILFLTILWSFNIPARMVFVLRPMTHILNTNKIYCPEYDYTEIMDRYFACTPCVCQQVDHDINTQTTNNSSLKNHKTNMGALWMHCDDEYLYNHRDDEVESLAMHFSRTKTVIRKRLEHILNPETDAFRVLHKENVVHDDSDKAVKRRQYSEVDAMDVDESDAQTSRKKKKKGKNSNRKWIASDDIYLWEYRDDPVHVLSNVLNRTKTVIGRRLEALRDRTSKARQRLIKHLPSNSKSNALKNETNHGKTPIFQRRPDFSHLGQHFIYKRNKGSMVECIEVYVSDIAQWVHIALDKGRIHIDLSENNLYQCDCDKNTNKISYAISVDKFGCVYDATPRYAEIWSIALRNRVMHNTFYMEMIQKWEIENEQISFQYEWQHVLEHKLWKDLLKRDRIQINKCIASEPIPKSEGLFRNHPLFVIEKFVKKYEAIYPTDESQVIGNIKGQNVYPICNLRDIHTRERWYKLGFVVNEAAKCIKQVKTSHMSKSEEEFTDLFGKWQCVKYIAPAIGAQDKIPTNSRGNIELWSDEHLPSGCVHIAKHGAIFAAKRMKIEYAKAMTGFDQRKGRSVPVFEGIVVHESHVEELYKIIAEMNVKRKEREEEKEMKMMCALWRNLVQGIMVQQQLETQQREKEANKRLITTKEFNDMMNKDHVEDL